MRFIVVILLLLSFGATSQTAYMEPAFFGGKDYYISVIYPPSYTDSVTKKYPTLIMMNGLGESQNNWGTINTQGPNYEILSGGWSSRTQVLGDSTFEFISISFQIAASGSTTASNDFVRLVDTLKARYRIDTCRIYPVGLSAGVQSFIRSAASTLATGNLGKRIQWTASFMMSSGNSYSSATLDSLAQWTRVGGSMQYMIGASDGTRLQVAPVLAACNGGRANSGTGYTWTSPPWPTAGHGGWRYGFDSSYHDPTTNDNAYQYLLKHSKRPWADAGQTTINITLPVNTATLNGITKQYSDGWNGWNLVKGWTQISGGAASITSSGSDTTGVTISGGSGTYVFRLTCTSSGGLVATKDVTVNVAAAPAEEPYILRKLRYSQYRLVE